MLKAVGLSKSFSMGESRLEILRGVDLEIRRGESVGLVGASGAGKSTLLSLIGTLDRPDSGELFFNGDSLLSMNDEDLAQFRNQEMGFVFQAHHLMAEFNAVENVMLPCQIAGESKGVARSKAEEVLSWLGMSERTGHFPNQLSGGELQRVALARALVRSPKILFADEPTGNLDSQNSLMVQNLLFSLKEKLGLTLVIVTHDSHFARRCSRCLRVADGKIISAL